jgi:FADH2 O2-dependent halogenase
MNPQHRFQIVVIGSGFAGSLAAMIARRLGFSTALLERGQHPRFVIGESSTPLANLLLEEIAVEYDLPFLRPLCKWGSWQKQVPQVACGLKRGFSFFQHQLDRPFAPDPDRRRQLLVGASPHEEVADTHWYRPEFDQYLVEQARSMGVVYWDEIEITPAPQPCNPWIMTGKRRGETFEFLADFVIDASGPRGFLHRCLHLAESPFPGFPNTQALFSHFAGVGPLPECFLRADPAPPFPIEQAAVHHVFPGGWVWVLKFNNGLTSAGVAAVDPLAEALQFRTGEPGWKKLLERLPSLARMFADSRATLPFVHQPRIAFQAARITGENWALLPSAAGVVDPLLSTGFPLTLIGMSRLGNILRSHWQRPSFGPELEEYARLTRLELETTARLVGALYATMDQFVLFKDLSLLYFAAASYSETARRLGKAHLADSFLLCRNAAFTAQMAQFCALAGGPLTVPEAKDLQCKIVQAIEPFDVAGLADRSRDPWYPCLTSDLCLSGHKLGATQDEMGAMLRRTGMSPGPG